MLTIEGWIDTSTRAIFINTLIYQPTYDLWIFVDILVEQTTEGVMYPNKLMAVVIQPNIFKRHTGAYTADIFRLMFSIWILYLYIKNIVSTVDGKKNIAYAYSFLGIIDILLVAIIIFTFALTFSMNEDEESIYKDQKYKDMTQLVINYRNYHIFNVMVLILVIIRIVMFGTINKRIYILLKTVEYAAKNMLSFMIILIFILSGFSIISMNIWGMYHFMFSKFEYALLSLLLLNIGQGITNELMEIDFYNTVIFYIIFYFSVLLFIMATFMGIYMDAYKMVRFTQGYEDDESKWTRSTFTMWIADWIPNIIKQKLFPKDEKKKRRPEQEEYSKEDSEPNII
jgi:hypothetical protein